MEAEQFDFGISGKKWTDEQRYDLLRCIKRRFCNRIPFSYSSLEIAKMIYPKSKKSRKPKEISTQIDNFLKDYLEPVYKITFNDIHYYVVQEYSKLESLWNFFRTILEKNKLINSSKEYSSSVIQVKLCKNEVAERDELVYIRPTILDADYAEVFTDIFSCSCLDEDSNTNLKNDLKLLCAISNHTPSVVIPIDNCIVRTAVYFLIDFLLAQIIGQIDTQKKREKKMDGPYHEIDEIEDILNELEQKIKYTNSQKNRILNKLQDAVFPDNDQTRELVKKNIEILKSICKSSTATSASIPEYRISTPGVFELYVYSKIHEAYKGLKKTDYLRCLRYKPQLKKNDDGGRMEPDITVEGHMLVVDAKYKFQYRYDKNCEFRDVQQMAKYLLKQDQDRMVDTFKTTLPNKAKINDKKIVITKINNSIVSPIGLWVYPTLQKEGPSIEDIIGTINKNEKHKESIDKVGLALPLNKNFIDNYEELEDPKKYLPKNSKN